MPSTRAIFEFLLHLVQSVYMLQSDLGRDGREGGAFLGLKTSAGSISNLDELRYDFDNLA